MMGRPPAGVRPAVTPGTATPSRPRWVAALRVGRPSLRVVAFGTLAPGAGPAGPGSCAPVRRTPLTAWVATGLLVLGGCAAGQEAETAEETPDTAGVDGTVGEVSLDDVFLDAEDTVAAGASVPLRGVLTNDAEQADRLVEVSTPAAGSVRLLDENGAPSADGIEVPAGGQVEAVSGAVRVQLEEVTAPIAPTDTVSVTFTFATAGEVSLDVPVTPGPGPVD
jgi:periplasmic copper chaperone A